MNFLIVEDDEFKRSNVSRVFESRPHAKLFFAKSIVSSLRILEENPSIDIVILDMSLPTYDVGPEESGGRPQGFGGLTVLQHIEALERQIHVIVLTQFQAFGEGEGALDLEGLETMLRQQYAKFFRGLIRYGAGSDQWRAELIQLISEVERD